MPLTSFYDFKTVPLNDYMERYIFQQIFDIFI